MKLLKMLDVDSIFYLIATENAVDFLFGCLVQETLFCLCQSLEWGLLPMLMIDRTLNLHQQVSEDISRVFHEKLAFHCFIAFWITKKE